MAEKTILPIPSAAKPAVGTSTAKPIVSPDTNPRSSVGRRRPVRPQTPAEKAPPETLELRRPEQRPHVDLSTLSRLLLASVDVDPAPRRLAGLTVPLLGDMCVVHLLDAHGQVDSVGVAHANPSQQALLDRVEQYWHKPSALDHPLARSWRAGESIFVPDVTDAWLQGAAADPVQRRLVQALEIRSLISVPLITQHQHQHLGALTTCCTDVSDEGHGATFTVRLPLADAIRMTGSS